MAHAYNILKVFSTYYYVLRSTVIPVPDTLGNTCPSDYFVLYVVIHKPRDQNFGYL